MKRVFMITVIASLIVCVCVCAQNTDESFGIKINDEDFVHKVPMIVIDGRSYVHLRDFGELINHNVNWNEEERIIEVDTPDIENKYVAVPTFTETDDGKYIPDTVEISLDVSEEAAISIADTVLREMIGESFFKENPDVEVIKNTDEIIEVLRYKELTVGGGAVVRIRKTDGKIMSVEFGE